MWLKQTRSQRVLHVSVSVRLDVPPLNKDLHVLGDTSQPAAQVEEPTGLCDALTKALKVSGSLYIL